MGCADSREKTVDLGACGGNRVEFCGGGRAYREIVTAEIFEDDYPVEVFHKLDTKERNFLYREDLEDALQRTSFYKRFERSFSKMFANLDEVKAEEGEDAGTLIDIHTYSAKLREFVPPFMVPDEELKGDGGDRGDAVHTEKDIDYGSEHRNFKPLEVYTFIDQNGDRNISAYEFKVGLKITDFVKLFEEDMWKSNWRVLLWKVINNNTHEMPTVRQLSELKERTDEQLQELWLDYEHISRWYRNLKYDKAMEDRRRAGKTGSGSIENTFGREYESDDDTATNSLIMKAQHRTLLRGDDKKAVEADFFKIWSAYDINKDGVLDTTEVAKLLSDLMYGLRDHVQSRKIARDRTGLLGNNPHVLGQELERVRANIMMDTVGLQDKFFGAFGAESDKCISKEKFWKKRARLGDFLRARLAQFESQLRDSRGSEAERKGDAKVQEKFFGPEAV